MILSTGVVLNQKRSGAIDTDQNVRAAIVSVVADRESTGCKVPLENRTGLGTHVAVLPGLLLEQQHWLAVPDVRRSLRDGVVRVAVGENQFWHTVIIEV